MSGNPCRRTVSDLGDCQPIFKVYCNSHGLRDGDEWITYEFIAWASRKAEEFRKARGLGVGEFTAYKAEYADWIKEKDAD